MRYALLLCLFMMLFTYACDYVDSEIMVNDVNNDTSNTTDSNDAEFVDNCLNCAEYQGCVNNECVDVIRCKDMGWTKCPPDNCRGDIKTIKSGSCCIGNCAECLIDSDCLSSYRCIDDRCVKKSCEDRGGVLCAPGDVCKGNIISVEYDYSCCDGVCVEIVTKSMKDMQVPPPDDGCDSDAYCNNAYMKCVNRNCIIKTCAEQGGVECMSSMACVGSSTQASDSSVCCIGSCNPESCSSDSDCDELQECWNNVCIQQSCSENSGDICSTDEICSQPFLDVSDSRCCPVTCQPISSDECSVDSDCDDSDPSTIDVCSGSPKTCSHSSIESCQDDDGYCPDDCTYSSDFDCPKENYCRTDADCDDSDPSTADGCQGPMSGGKCAYSYNCFCFISEITKCQEGDDYCPPDCSGTYDTDCGPPEGDLAFVGPIVIKSFNGNPMPDCSHSLYASFTVVSTLPFDVQAGNRNIYVDDELVTGISGPVFEPGSNEHMVKIVDVHDLNNKNIRLEFDTDMSSGGIFETDYTNNVISTDLGTVCIED